ncbi:SDR family oxidoreductase [Botryobacter ruber]|uniref:SDR family oxidoreductase n=1 Tax=Botryobacter ruber TaxID=2171629 RepID=UPI002938D31D|nr:SDR family oxidoreductase [Botryobacter ruber]
MPFHNKPISHLTFLVTGGGGFVGSNLVEYLLQFGAGKVRVLDNFSSGYRRNLAPFRSDPAFELLEGDIRDLGACAAACAGVDVVLHQAALGSVLRSVRNPVPTNEVNVGGFVNMLTAAKEAGVKRFVYASSSSVYGDSKVLPKVELHTGKPLSPYAVSKQVNELYADVFSRMYGLETIGLRYFNIFGPRQNPQGENAAVIPLFINALLQEQTPELHGDGRQTRDFTFVENCVQANIKAALTDNPAAVNQVYNIATGACKSLLEVLEIVEAAIGVNVEPVYGNTRPGDIRDSLADIAKATYLLEYQPRVSIEEGLRRTCQWYKHNRDFLKKD